MNLAHVRLLVGRSEERGTYFKHKGECFIQFFCYDFNSAILHVDTLFWQKNIEITTKELKHIIVVESSNVLCLQTEWVFKQKHKDIKVSPNVILSQFTQLHVV